MKRIFENSATTESAAAYLAEAPDAWSPPRCSSSIRKSGSAIFPTRRFLRIGPGSSAAVEFFVVTSGDVPVPAWKITAELTEENDVVFKLVFPRPAAGRLHFHAAFLKKLGPGYGGIIEISDGAGHDLGWEQLSFENPNFEIVVAAPEAPARESRG